MSLFFSPCLCNKKMLEGNELVHNMYSDGGRELYSSESEISN